MSGTRLIDVFFTASVNSERDAPGIVDAVQGVIRDAGGSITAAESFARDQATMFHEFSIAFTVEDTKGGNLTNAIIDQARLCARDIEDKIPVAVQNALRRSNIRARVSAFVSAQALDTHAYAVFTWNLVAPNEIGMAMHINKVLSSRGLLIKTQSVRTGKKLGILNVQAIWLLVGEFEATHRHFALLKMDEVTHRISQIGGVVIKNAELAICRGTSNIPLNDRHLKDADVHEGELVRIPYNGELKAIQERFTRLEFDGVP